MAMENFTTVLYQRMVIEKQDRTKKKQKNNKLKDRKQHKFRKAQNKT
jgi:hypothetical protein